MDTYNVGAELSALRRKLESKTEALLILSQELNKCRIERDQLKLIADKIHARNPSVRPAVPHEEYGLYSGCYSCNNQLQDIKEKNRSLMLEVEDLKQKLRDAQGDIKVLRHARGFRGNGNCNGNENGAAELREELVRQVEEAAARADSDRRALREAVDERAELEREAAHLRSRLANLAQQLSHALQAKAQGRPVDLDALLMENKYLQERLEQALAEKELCHQTLTKYKGMLDKRRMKGTVKLGSGTSTYGMVVTHKQVQELLEGGDMWKKTEATLADLRSLSLALLDALQDKTLALAHQKKANKILAGRVTELEARLGPPLPLFTSTVNLEGLLNTVDDDIESTIRSLSKEESNDIENKEDRRIETVSDESDETDTGEKSTALASDNTNEDDLPADLQELVMKAMQEIKQGSHSID